LLAAQIGIIIEKICRILFFPSDELKKWLKFCRRADKKFAVEATKAKAGKPNNLRICSAHITDFVLESPKRALNGRGKILESALPTISKPNEKRSPRDVRYESVRKNLRSGRTTILNLITPEADNLKYWDKNKNKNCNTKLHLSLNPGQKEVLASLRNF